jgi:hypothetical protein
LKELAQASGLSMAAYLYQAAFGEARPRRVRRPIAELETLSGIQSELALISAELGKWGSNINQIARAVNTDAARGQDTPPDRLLAELEQYTAHLGDMAANLERVTGVVLDLGQVSEAKPERGE